MFQLRIFVREALYPDANLPEQNQEHPIPPLGLIGVVDEVHSFQAIPRWNSIGNWTLEIPTDSPQAKWFVPGRGIVVFKEGSAKPIFSGPIRKIKKSWNADDGTVEKMLTVSGVDDNTLLSERLTWPTPDVEIDWQGYNIYWQTDLTWDNVGVLLKNLLIDNTAGLEDRWLPKFYIPREDPDLLDDDTAKSTLLRMNQIDTEISKLTSVYGFRINCIWHPNPDSVADAKYSDSGPGILVEIQAVHDFTDDIQFGPHLGNLQSYEYEVEAPSATRPVIGAQHRKYTELEIKPTYDQSDTINGYTEVSKEIEGPERYYQYFRNSELDPDWWGDELETPADMQWTVQYAQRGLTSTEVQWGITAERFLDLSSVDWQWARDPNDSPTRQLEPPVWSKQYQAIQTEVSNFHADNGPKADIKLVPIETPETPAVFADYWLGDSVRLHIDSEVRDEVFREAEIIVDPDEGHLIKPVVGSDGASNTPYLYRQVKALWNAIHDSKIEDLTQAPIDVPEPAFGFTRVEEAV